jgi:hypothetical protein
LSEPELITFTRVEESTKALVRAFYESQENSRMMPGIKVSLGKGVSKQKILLLCNLQELFALFKKQYPMEKIGFSMFCSLRPKWCITVRYL